MEQVNFAGLKLGVDGEFAPPGGGVGEGGRTGGDGAHPDGGVEAVGLEGVTELTRIVVVEIEDDADEIRG